MSTPNDSPDPDLLLQEAIEWVVRLKAGQPTRADADALMQWRGQSPAHEDAFKKAVRQFRNAGTAARELADSENSRAASAAASRQVPRAGVTRRRMLVGGGIAAAGAYAIVRPPLGLWPSLGELSADYRTGKGEQRRVVVSPNISLELNTQTSVSIRSASSDVQVELISGEAVINASGATRALVVLAAGGRTSAMAADFNVRCIDGVVSITCLAGALDVERSGRSVQAGKGQQVSYSDAGIVSAVGVDATQTTAWKSGLLVFKDRPLADVVSEVNRYRSGKIIITNDELRKRVVNGTFQIDGLDKFVGQVTQLFGAKATSLPGGVVFLS